MFSHIDNQDVGAAMDTSEVCSTNGDGPGRYQLSTMCAYHVCHIKKEGRCVIYSNQNVCASKKPPKDLGSIYAAREWSAKSLLSPFTTSGREQTI